MTLTNLKYSAKRIAKRFIELMEYLGKGAAYAIRN